MRLTKSGIAAGIAAAIVAGLLAVPREVIAAPLAGTSITQPGNPGMATKVWYRGPSFPYDPGNFSDGDLEPNQGMRHGWLGPQLSGGVLRGQTVIAGAIAEHRATKADMRLCDARYRNFDPATGTYLDRRGDVRVCPFLY